MCTNVFGNGKIIQFFISIAATILSITDGMTVAWSSPMVPYLISSESHIKMTQSEAEWIETCFLIGVICTIPLSAYLINKLGRKKSLLTASMILMVCWIAIACATRKEIIYGARVLTGAGINLGFVAVPTYIGEIADKDIRGFLSSLMQIMVMLGILLMYIIGSYTSYIVPPLTAASLLFLQILIFWSMPETPYLLCMKNKITEAKQSLQILRNTTDVEEELNEIVRAIDVDMRDKKGTFKELFIVPRYRVALFIVLTFDFTKLCSCFEVVLMNIHQMMDGFEMGFITPSNIAITFAILLLLSSLLSSLLIDRFGRKVLFTISSILTATILFVLGIYLNLKSAGYNVQNYGWIPAISIIIYAMVYKVGMGTVPFIIMTEIYATRIKGRCIALSNGFHTATAIIVFQIYFMLRRTYGIHIHFYIFGFLTVLVMIFIIYFVPETRGKSLEEIQQILRNKSENKFNYGTNQI